MEDSQDKPGKAAGVDMALARKRFQLAFEAEKGFRKLAVEDLKFSIGDADNGYQWDPQHKQIREDDGKPCLTSNRLGQFIHQITNEQRQNRPAVIVDPVDDGADKKTAEVLQGLVRHIESNSSAYVAYATAGDFQVRMGVGCFRLLTDFVDSDGFDNEQEIFIKPILDPLSVYFDPNTKEVDRSDAEFCFIVSSLPIDEYKRLYDKADGAGMDFETFERLAPGWRTGETVQIAEYFYVERKMRVKVRLADGSKLWKDELKAGELAARRRIVDEREVESRVINWCKIDGIGELESSVWPGKWIPVIEVPGEEFMVNGQRERFGLVRMMKDPQRMFNVWRSALTETIGLAPRSPFVGHAEVFEGYEQYWDRANVKNFSRLPYKAVVKDGVLLPKPERNFGEPPIQAITIAGQQSIEDMHGTSGIYPPSLGQKSNESSGRAILARQAESDVANYHFGDNLARAIEFCGRQLVDLIPKIYDTERVIRILGEDGTPSMVRVNGPTVDNGVERIYDLTTGRYDVRVRQGPSFATKRQQAADALLELSAKDPRLMQMAGDLIFKTLDIPYADKFAERLTPPEFREQEGETPIPPEVKQQLQAFQQQHEQLVGIVNDLTAKLNEKSADRASNEHIAALKAEADIYKAELQAGVSEMRETMQIIREDLAAIRQPGPVEG